MTKAAARAILIGSLFLSSAACSPKVACISTMRTSQNSDSFI